MREEYELQCMIKGANCITFLNLRYNWEHEELCARSLFIYILGTGFCESAIWLVTTHATDYFRLL